MWERRHINVTFLRRVFPRWTKCRKNNAVLSILNYRLNFPVKEAPLDKSHNFLSMSKTWTWLCYFFSALKHPKVNVECHCLKGSSSAVIHIIINKSVYGSVIKKLICQSTPLTCEYISPLWGSDSTVGRCFVIQVGVLCVLDRLTRRSSYTLEKRNW